MSTEKEHSINLSIKGTVINPKLIKSLWRDMFPHIHIPIILAMNVSKEEFLKQMKIIRDYEKEQGVDPYRQEILEHGKASNGEASGAFVVKADSKSYIILRRIDSDKTLKDNLKHELNHIGKGEADNGISTKVKLA